MKNSQKPDHISLQTLLTRLQDGRYVVPNFQREFEWRPWDICDLVRSIFLDYYIGSLLLWKGTPQNIEALSCTAIYGHSGPDERESIVLDGQQRLTAMYYAFVGPKVALPNRAMSATYQVRIDRLMAQDYDEAFVYEWQSKRLDKFLEDREAQYEAHRFPCPMLTADFLELADWLAGYRDYCKNRLDIAREQGDEQSAAEFRQHLANATEFKDLVGSTLGTYQISYVELDRDLGISKICDIFTQLNSKGVRLDVFDLMNALLTPKGLELKAMWQKARDSLRFVDTPKMNVYVLQVMSILKQAYCSPNYLYFLMPGNEKPIREPDGTRRKEVLVNSTEEFEKLWGRSVTALKSSIDTLRQPQEFGVHAPEFLPYPSILPVFAALRSELNHRPAAQHFSGFGKIRRWYWSSVFTSRYSGSVESTAARDFLDVCRWFDDEQAEPGVIQEFKVRLPELDLRGEVRKGTSVYNGIFNLLVIAGARDWSTNGIPQPDEIDDHHIVPASWGTKHLPSGAIHTILNRTPITATTNRKIVRDRLPNEYLPELVQLNGKSAVLATMETHFISATAFEILCRKEFTPPDFEAFIAERRRTIFDAIESLLIKDRLDLPPNLRLIDIEVEEVELGLRKIIDSGLSGDPTLIPGSIAPKVKERLLAAERKNPALAPDRDRSLALQLEFCDFRELQEIMTNKANWPRFENQFLVKEQLNAKFGQLAELRNALRHSRTVDEVTRKEGEAAIIWFRQNLTNE